MKVSARERTVSDEHGMGIRPQQHSILRIIKIFTIGAGRIPKPKHSVLIEPSSMACPIPGLSHPKWLVPIQRGPPDQGLSRSGRLSGSTVSSRTRKHASATPCNRGPPPDRTAHVDVLVAPVSMTSSLVVSCTSLTTRVDKESELVRN